MFRVGLPQFCVYSCLLFRWFLKTAVSISLSRNNYLVLVMKTMCVFCDVLTEIFMCEIGIV